MASTDRKLGYLLFTRAPRSAALFFLSVLGLTVAAAAATLELTPTDRLLILVPHPDDEVLCCGGLIQKAVQDHVPVKIVLLTHGDNNAWAFTRYRHFPVFRPKTMRAMGQVRRDETLAAAGILGAPSDAFLFLGYPDFGTLSIWNAHWERSPPYESRMTRVQAVPYPTAYRPGAAYKGEEILRDLKSILQDFRPTKVWVPHPADLQTDHRALYLFTRVALWDLARDIAPEVYAYLVHFPDWPSRRGLHKDQALEGPSLFNRQAHWLTLPLTIPGMEKKREALRKYRTQWAYSRRFMTSHVRSNELFDPSPEPPEKPAQTDFEEWQVAVDGKDLILSGRLSQKRKVSTKVGVAAYGYRSDTPFEKMPKIYVKLSRGQPAVYDRNQQARDSGVRLQRDRRQFTVRIPLQTLGWPERIFTSGGITRKREPLIWNFWQILDRGSEARSGRDPPSGR